MEMAGDVSLEDARAQRAVARGGTAAGNMGLEKGHRRQGRRDDELDVGTARHCTEGDILGDLHDGNNPAAADSEAVVEDSSQGMGMGGLLLQDDPGKENGSHANAADLKVSTGRNPLRCLRNLGPSIALL